jgi:putative alpha-1,2-mannosidase
VYGSAEYQARKPIAARVCAVLFRARRFHRARVFGRFGNYRRLKGLQTQKTVFTFGESCKMWLWTRAKGVLAFGFLQQKQHLKKSAKCQVLTSSYMTNMTPKKAVSLKAAVAVLSQSRAAGVLQQRRNSLAFSSRDETQRGCRWARGRLREGRRGRD